MGHPFCSVTSKRARPSSGAQGQLALLPLRGRPGVLLVIQKSRSAAAAPPAGGRTAPPAARLVVQVGQLRLALALEAAHHILEGQVVAARRGLGLPDPGAVVPGGTLAAPGAAAAALPRAARPSAPAAFPGRTLGGRQQLL